MTVYVTVDYFGAARRDRPPCDGCTPPGDPSNGDLSKDDLRAELAVLRVVGASGGMHLCTSCARDVVKSIAARFVLHDRRSTRDLMDFFAAEARKKPTRRRRRAVPAARMIAAADGEVAVLPRSARMPKSTKKGTS